jgi:predicted outer membrane repeat protein
MDGGVISGNSAALSGGGIYMNNSTVTMNDGVISGNSAVGSISGTDSGGGIFLTGSSTFTMDGGVISGNSAALSGGGVYLFTGTFIMNRGVISGNFASSSGGGINVSASGKFAKIGGTIYGYDNAAPDDPNSNVVKNSSGVIQNGQGHTAYINNSYRKETTVGPENQLYYSYPDHSDSGW